MRATKPLRVLLLCEGDPEGEPVWSGSANALLSALRAAGCTVDVVDCELRGLSRAIGLVATFAPRRRRWWVRYRLGDAPFRLRSRIAAGFLRASRHKYDVLLQIGATFEVPESEPVPLLLYCDSNIAISIEGKATGVSEASFLTARELDAVRSRERRSYARAAHVFTMSDYLRSSFVTSFGVDLRRVSVARSGINVPPSTVSIPYGARPPRVLFVGKDFERKGGSLLLEAFTIVRQHVAEAELWIVGPEFGGEELPPGVRSLGFLRQTDVRESQLLQDAFNQARVFCMPTRFEALGIAFLEAMSRGIPCIGPKRWAVPEMIQHEETGLLVDSDSPNAWAAAILRLITEPSFAESLGSEGRRRALALFRWDRVAAHILTTAAGIVDATSNVGASEGLVG